MAFTSSAGRARSRARMEPPDRNAHARTSDAGPGTLVRAVVEGLRVTVAVAADPRVSVREKLVAGAALLYLISPIDLISDVFLGIGQLDDLGILFWGWRHLMQAAGRDVVADHWRGDLRAMDLVLGFAGVED
jgi:uncharacterized membrane protein YkvA (DUF1232 family)